MYAVGGLTCARCIVAVMDEIRTISGVTGVAVDLVKGGLSPLTVTADPAVSADTIRQSVQDAGFHVADRGTKDDVP